MQIYGIAKDQNGKEYYMVKNSWGDAGTYKRHLVRFESIRCLQDHEYRSEQKCHPRTNPEKIGAELKKTEEQPLSHKERKLPRFFQKRWGKLRFSIFSYFYMNNRVAT